MARIEVELPHEGGPSSQIFSGTNSVIMDQN